MCPWEKVCVHAFLQDCQDKPQQGTGCSGHGGRSYKVLIGLAYARWFRDGQKKWESTLGWVLSGSGDNSVTGYLHQSHLEVEQDNTKTKAIIIKDISVYSIYQDEGMSGHFYDLYSVHILSVFRNNYTESYFCLDPSQDQSGRDWCWHSVQLYIHEENTKAWLRGPD